MRMSMTITSGAALAACSIASRPSAASATTSMSGSPSRIMRKPARISSWSSTIRTRIVIRRRSRVGEPRLDREAAALARPGRERAAVQGDPLAHADEPVAARIGGRARPAAVVEDRELDRLVGVP